MTRRTDKRVCRARGSRFVALAAACFLLVAAGCAVVSSDLLESNNTARSGDPLAGVVYSLPVSVIDLTLAVVPKTAEFKLTVDGPRSIADPRHRYVLRYKPHASYTDTVDIAVTDKTFLSAVTLTTKDETPSVILNIFKTLGALGQGFEAGTTPAGAESLATVTFNPTDESDKRRGMLMLNRALLKFAKKSFENCEKTAKKGREAESNFDPQAQAVCKEYGRLAQRGEQWLKLPEDRRWTAPDGDLAPVVFVIRPAGDAPVARRSAAKATAVAHKGVSKRTADCTVGICYRPRLPYEIGYAVGSIAKTRTGQDFHRGIVKTYMMLPNESDLVEIDISRAFFVEKTQKITFDESGFLKYWEVKKPSELVALAGLPVAIVSAVADGLKIRIKLVQQEINEAGALKDLIEARQALLEQKQALETAIKDRTGEPSRATSVTALPLPIQPTPQSAVGTSGLQTVDGLGSR